MDVQWMIYSIMGVRLHYILRYAPQACTDVLPKGKRKAKYSSNPDRGLASYNKMSRKAAAKLAIADWLEEENVEPPESAVVISGSRIMNIGELSKSIVELTMHSTKCGDVCFVQGEIQRAGLAVVLAATV